jgi:catechol 2,3-dioxygenase
MRAQERSQLQELDMQKPAYSGDGGPSRPFTGARIGHINLKVADLNRSLAFYEGVLGFKVTKRTGDEAAFLAYGDYHHDICINTWESRDGSQPPEGTTGLFHLAIVYSTRAELRDAYLRLKNAGIAPDSAVDHGVSESLYLRDPDQNGVELYWDRNPDRWWGDSGELKMGHRPVDPEELLRPDASEVPLDRQMY